MFKTPRTKMLLIQTIKLFTWLGFLFIIDMLDAHQIILIQPMFRICPIIAITLLALTIACSLLHDYKFPLFANQIAFLIYCIIIYYNTYIFDFIVLLLCMISMLDTYSEVLPLYYKQKNNE